MKTKIIQINIFEKRMFTIFTMTIFILLCLYGYFISKSIINIIVREEINNNMLAVSYTISDLEYKYIANKNVINKEFVRSAGFKELAGKQFIARKIFAKLSVEN